MPKTKKESKTARKNHLTREEVAGLLGIHPRSVYYLISRGLLKPMRSSVGMGKGGRRVYFDRLEVESLRAGMIGKSSNRSSVRK